MLTLNANQLSSNSFQLTKLITMTQVVSIICKPEAIDDIKSSGLGYSYQQESNTIEVLVENNYDLNDEQLCTHYDLDYNLINCIQPL